MDNPNGNYDDTNRAFMQAFFARGQISTEECSKILAPIFAVQSSQSPRHAPAPPSAKNSTGQKVEPKDVTKEDIATYIAAAADALSPLDYEVRNTLHQQTKDRIYALVNSISDPLTQMATTRTSDEVFYIKRLLDVIFDTNNKQSKEVMAITSMQALGQRKPSNRRESEEGSQLAVDKGLTGTEAESLLAGLVQEKWFEHSKDGYYTLSPRALMELRSWLVETYNDDEDDWQRIKFCFACKDIVTVGQRCADLDCNVRLHNICEAAYWNSRPSKKCPKCERPWEGKQYVGEKVLTASKDRNRGGRASGAQNGSARRQSGRGGDEEEEQPNGNHRRNNRRESPEEEEEEEEEEDDE